MSYSIKIGNAEIDHVVDEDEVNESPEYRIRVRTMELPEAPSFTGDINDRKNVRWPSYGGWARFCENTNLGELFYGPPGERSAGLFASHPGAVQLTRQHLARVRAATEEYLARPWPAKERIPGWDPTLERYSSKDGDPCYDADLARLRWLEWWMDWALKNCEHPCMENS